MSTSSTSCDLCIHSIEPEDHDEYIANLEEDEDIKRMYNNARPKKFENYFENYKENPNSIFNLPGISLIRYTHKKIKLSFQPSLVAEMVSAKLIFFVSLKYRMGYWMVKRNYVPVNYKWKICKVFYGTDSYSSRLCFTDENVAHAIRKIWEILCIWAVDDDHFRKDKRRRYRDGDDVYIDEDDEELFLTAAEVQELHRRRNEIWKRMLPQPISVLQRRKRKCRQN